MPQSSVSCRYVLNVFVVSKYPDPRNSVLCRFSASHRHDYPVIPYSERLCQVLVKDKRSRQLLDMLELSYEPFNNSYLPHIPTQISAEKLFSLAECLRSIENCKSREYTRLQIDSASKLAVQLVIHRHKLLIHGVQVTYTYGTSYLYIRYSL